jgi:hypothetical protein
MPGQAAKAGQGTKKQAFQAHAAQSLGKAGDISMVNLPAKPAQQFEKAFYQRGHW